MDVSMVVAISIAIFFTLIGLLLSGALNRIQRRNLKKDLNISELEQSMYDLQAEADKSLANQHNTKNLDWFERTAKELEQSHTGITMPIYLGIMMGSMIIVMVLAYVILKSLLLAAIASLLGLVIPKAVVNMKRQKDVATFNANLVKALRRMGSNLRAGGTLKQAVMDVGKSASMPTPIRNEFINILSDMEYGDSIETALYKLYDRTGVEDVRTMALTVEIQRRTGGNLAEAFDNLARLINKRELQEADIKATLSQAKASSKLISFMPFAMTLLLNVISPNYFDTFYAWGDGLGRIIAFFMYGMIVVGIFVIGKMSDIKI